VQKGGGVEKPRGEESESVFSCGWENSKLTVHHAFSWIAEEDAYLLVDWGRVGVEDFDNQEGIIRGGKGPVKQATRRIEGRIFVGYDK